jgi:hypothetical protein
MDINNEKTDQFFRERLSVYEEMPGDQVWDKIASRIEAGKRRKFIYLFLRIAAGMTLLFSLGLGYHLLYKSGNQGIKGLTARTSASEKSVVKQSNIAAGKSLKIEKEPHQLKNKPTYLYSTALNSGSDNNAAYQSAPANSKAPVLTALARLVSSPLPVSAPQKLGYRRLSQQEIQEQTAALSTGNDDEMVADEVQKDNRWVLGSEVAPLYSYRKIESDYLNSSAVQNYNKAEQGLVSLAGGLRVGYAAGKRLSVQSGLYYSRYGQQNTSAEAVSIDQVASADNATVTYLSISNSTGTIQAGNGKDKNYANVISSPAGDKTEFFNYGFHAIGAGNIPVTEGDITAVQYFDYLELPVSVKYKIIDRKLSFSFLGGVITNFLVNNGVQIKQDGNEESFGTTRDINKVNYQGSVGLGLDYPIMDRMAISLEPRFRYYLNPIDQRFNVHPYSFGIFAGISYTLK